jgi:hypothetical protein
MIETASSWMAYVGMTSILVAFLLETRGVLSSRGGTYLWLMAAGSGLLALRAGYSREWAFLVLEVVWCAAAVWALAETWRGRAPAAAELD